MDVENFPSQLQASSKVQVGMLVEGKKKEALRDIQNSQSFASKGQSHEAHKKTMKRKITENKFKNNNEDISTGKRMKGSSFEGEREEVSVVVDKTTKITVDEMTAVTDLFFDGNPVSDEYYDILPKHLQLEEENISQLIQCCSSLSLLECCDYEEPLLFLGKEPEYNLLIHDFTDFLLCPEEDSVDPVFDDEPIH